MTLSRIAFILFQAALCSCADTGREHTMHLMPDTASGTVAHQTQADTQPPAGKAETPDAPLPCELKIVKRQIRLSKADSFITMNIEIVEDAFAAPALNRDSLVFTINRHTFYDYNHYKALQATENKTQLICPALFSHHKIIYLPPDSVDRYAHQLPLSGNYFRSGTLTGALTNVITIHFNSQPQNLNDLRLRYGLKNVSGTDKLNTAHNSKGLYWTQATLPSIRAVEILKLTGQLMKEKNVAWIANEIDTGEPTPLDN